MLLKKLLHAATASTVVSANRPLAFLSQQRRELERSVSPTAMKSSAASDAGASSSSGGGLFLFDFDGVVCDSCDECTIAALRTCRQLGVLGDDPLSSGDAPPPVWLLERMREIRPAIEVGWQIPVLLAVQLEQRRRKEEMTAEEIIQNYGSLVSGALEKWEKVDKDMIEAFGGVRDAWMADDLNSWLDANVFYPGVSESIASCKGEPVLVTTKQHRFAVALMRHAGVQASSLPDGDIYGLGMYKGKADVIADRMCAGGFEAENTFFFEDRWPTLAKCLKDERLNGVRFFLCEWGYVAPHELVLAKAEPRVEILGLDRFKDVVAA